MLPETKQGVDALQKGLLWAGTQCSVHRKSFGHNFLGLLLLLKMRHTDTQYSFC